MSEASRCFEPCESLLPGVAEQGCRACVTVPARNEAEALPRCLDALGRQVDLSGSPLAPELVEVLLLLNNCTDRSAEVACQWQSAHPRVKLHVAERTLAGTEAHVGAARRLLMDTAWKRMRGHGEAAVAVLSTDADTQVAPDWIAQNLRTLQDGADVVGGVVEVLPEEAAALPSHIRCCHWRDRRYARLVALLEHLLDPQEGDPWPRHLDHFGSSLACTPEAYEKAGGMPAVSPLEDEAFIDGVRRACLKLRHAPEVRVYTSARLQGRAVMGLAGQLRLWSKLEDCDAHVVRSAAFLEHRFRSMRRLREIFATGAIGDLHLPTEWWVNTFQDALRRETTCPGFLGAVYCDILIAESFRGQPEEPIQHALDGLRERIAAIVASHDDRTEEIEIARPEPWLDDAMGLPASAL